MTELEELRLAYAECSRQRFELLAKLKNLLQETEPVAWLNDLLRRAWDALDSFKQAYPENWNDEDQQVMDDLIRADLKLSGVKLKWQGLTDEEIDGLRRSDDLFEDAPMWGLIARAIEAKLKEKNNG